MNRSRSRVGAAAAAIGFVLVAGCGGGQPAADDSPEGRAFQYRHAVMTVVGQKMLTLGGIARGEITADDAAFTKAASDLAVMAGMTTEAFTSQGIPSGSRALPAIWESWSDFERRAQDFQQAAQAVAEAAQRGGLEAARDLVRPLQQTCGGCHSTYRKPEE